VPTEARDVARIELLASIHDETNFEARPGGSPITLDVAVALFPVALRVVPDGRLSDAFLRALCAEAYGGADSTHLVPEAAAALGSVAVDRDHEFDAQTRSYATAALGSFPVELATPPLRALAARKLFGSAPKELRHAAEEILERFQRDAALARPVP
jgi:hypothetical protein